MKRLLCQLSLLFYLTVCFCVVISCLLVLPLLHPLFLGITQPCRLHQPGCTHDASKGDPDSDFEFPLHPHMRQRVNAKLGDDFHHYQSGGGDSLGGENPRDSETELLQKSDGATDNLRQIQSPAEAKQLRSETELLKKSDGATNDPSPKKGQPNSEMELLKNDAVDEEKDDAVDEDDDDDHGDDDDDLREFRSAQEETRRLHKLLLQAEDRAPPPLTEANCSELVHTAGNLQGDHGSRGTSSAQDHLQANVRGEGGTKTPRRSTPRNVTELLEVTQNCTGYLLNSGFLFPRVSQEELSFPLAFSLLVHKDLEQVERLLRAVFRPHNVYCLHADRKAPPEFHNGLRNVANCLPNVVLAQSSVNVSWGTISVLEPEVQCMRQLLAHSAPWRYFINLTGQEFPLKTNRELVRILTALRGANVITGSTDKSFNFRWKWNPKPVPYNLTVNKGDVHIIASRGYVDYVINSRVARDLYDWLRDTVIPDESFFSTLNYNPQLGVPGSYIGPADTSNSQTFRSLKIWAFSPDKHLCRGKWVRWICHFGVGDLPVLTSSPFLIANKFSYDFQPLAYDCLEKWYFDKVRQENDGVDAPLNMTVYQNSKMVQHRYEGPVLISG